LKSIFILIELFTIIRRIQDLPQTPLFHLITGDVISHIIFAAGQDRTETIRGELDQTDRIGEKVGTGNGNGADSERHQSTFTPEKIPGGPDNATLHGWIDWTQ
jgi:hypothetical protein